MLARLRKESPQFRLDAPGTSRHSRSHPLPSPPPSVLANKRKSCERFFVWIRTGDHVVGKLQIVLVLVLVVVGSETGFAADLDSPSGSRAYLGNRGCQKCHYKWYKSWAKTTMSKAFELLKPGKAVAAKESVELDPTKDYTQDETCLPCQTTGYGNYEGYT